MLAPFFVAVLYVAAFILMTLALTRGIPRVVWQIALCLFVALVALVLALKEITKGTREKREVLVTREYASSVRASGFPISVQRAFEASFSDGFHGDGARLTAYRYPPAESEGLLDSLKRVNPAMAWREIPSKNYAFSSLRELLPPDFLPEPASRFLLVGSPADGLPVQEFVLDRSRGIFYIIDNVF